MRLPLKRYEEILATYDNVHTGDMVIVGWWAPVEYITYRYYGHIRVSYDRGGRHGGVNMTTEEFDAYGYLKVPPGGLLVVLPKLYHATCERG